MAASNSHVYVIAESGFFTEERLPIPTLTVHVNVVRRYRCDTDDTNYVLDYNSRHHFNHPFHLFGSSQPEPNRDAVVAAMLSALRIPFPLENLYGKDPRRFNGDGTFMVTPLDGLDAMVRMISGVAGQVVRVGSASGRTSASMRVVIENRVEAPLRFIELLRRSRELDPEELS
ncbi:hypothetical protein TorRG33x02_111660 [Trema orientale]|uniref:Uncharacterized protein n=1 Tax=Trema orientale TaxID=63057 RepID=A0A2P5F512_TREOI|nr:hypothetical protein TorRG33x02_111660 [Trema orientale]